MKAIQAIVSCVAGLVCVGSFGSAFAQRPLVADLARSTTLQKKVLSPDAWSIWKGIQAPTISGDGAWVAYNLTLNDGRAELIVRSTVSATQYRVPRGRISQPKSDLEYLQQSGPGVQRPIAFTADSHFLLFTITAPTEAARAPAHATDEAVPAASTLGIMSLPGGEITRVEGVSTFLLPRDSGRYVAYTQEIVSIRHKAPSAAKTARILVIRELATGREIQIPDASEFIFGDAGADIAYAIPSVNSENAGVYVHHLVDKRTFKIISGRGDYRSLCFDHAGRQLAFLSDREEPGNARAGYSIYLATSVAAPAEAVVRAMDLPTELSISAHAGVRFTAKADALTFKLTPRENQSVLDPSGPSNADVELWNWKDVLLPDSKRRLTGRLTPSYLSIYHIGTRHWVQLAREAIPEVQLGDDTRYAVGFDQAPYQWGREWTNNNAVDIYLVDGFSGHASLLRRQFRSGENFWIPYVPGVPVRLSPSGRYLLYFENRRWFSYDRERAILHDLTGQLLPDVHFEFSRQSSAATRLPVPIGLAGWTAGDRRVLIYDQYDIWEVDPTAATPPRNLTAGVGGRTHTVFRLWPETRELLTRNTGRDHIDTRRPMLMTAWNHDTGAMGLWRLIPGMKPQSIVMGDRKVTLVAKAAHAERYLLTQETFSEFPDLWAGSRLDRLTQISNVNPQQREYRWGNAEVVEFTSAFGVPLRGVLYKPEDFDRSRKYPMIVSIYDTQSAGRYFYRFAVYESFDPTILVSNEYIVFEPDIVSASPFPGEMAMAAVLPAIESIVDRGYVEPKRIGLIGKSWGGYETNYLITHTDLFRCAVEEAGASDSISGYPYYLGLYETGALFHGASLWERPEVYLVNSPVLFADRVRTPLLMRHNEQDHNVPFFQGTEFFTALRRNHREVYLVNYKHEGHGIFRAEDKLDWAQRTQGFFDHFLKDAPEPDWMKAESHAATERPSSPMLLPESAPSDGSPSAP